MRLRRGLGTQLSSAASPNQGINFNAYASSMSGNSWPSWHPLNIFQWLFEEVPHPTMFALALFSPALDTSVLAGRILATARNVTDDASLAAVPLIPDAFYAEVRLRAARAVSGCAAWTDPTAQHTTLLPLLPPPPPPPPPPLPPLPPTTPPSDPLQRNLHRFRRADR